MLGSEAGIPPQLSIYLDFLRLIACLSVFFYHAQFYIDVRALYWVFTSAGREAVAIFFVLSGFVIFYVGLEKEKEWKTYALARIARILPVAVLAVTMTLLLDFIGNAIHPQYYALLRSRGGFFHADGLIAAVRDLSFTNEIWYSHSVLGSNEPFWSLGFEVWYYILFGLALFLPKKWKMLGLAVGCSVCGLPIILYLPLWLIGGLTYMVVRRIARPIPLIISIALFVVTVIGLKLCISHHDFSGSMYDPLSLRNISTFIYNLVVATLAAVNLICFHCISSELRVFSDKFATFVRWLSGASFTLYLIHLPWLVFVRGFFNDAESNSALVAVVSCTVIFGAALLTAELAERRKKIFVKLLTSLQVRPSVKGVA